VGRFRLVGRPSWARFAAPAAFLLAVTGIVLLVRTSLRADHSSSPMTTRAAPVTTRAVPRPAAPRPAVAPKQYYVIKSGDTLDAIAGRFATTVDKLLLLNPGIQPTALTPGERVRVK
jgi:LysM repeat protein